MIFLIIYLLHSGTSIVIQQLPLDTQQVKAALIEMLENNELECNTLELLVQRGYGHEIMNLITDELIVLDKHLMCAKQYIMEDINNYRLLRNKIQGTEDTKITMSPVVQWAQSKLNLLIRIKFSHRVDAPAYLNVNNHQIQCNSTSLEVMAESEQLNKLILFKTNIEFYDVVVQDQQEYWKLESVGTMVLNITKQEPKLWHQLSKTKVDKYLIWWDMKKQIGKDMEDFSIMLEQMEDQKQQDRKDQRKQNKEKKLNKEKAKEGTKGIVGKVMDWFN